LIDIDIVGLSNKNKKIYTQVTYSKLKHCKTKFENLKKYTSEKAQAIFFCNCPKPEIIDKITIYPLQLVFDTFCKSEIGKKWLNAVFK